MAADTPPSQGGSRATRGVPPLMLTATAVSVLALLLPSALRVPQQDPTPVLEFAPVPPTDDAPQTNQGNLSSLALGSSDTLSETVPPPPPPPPGTGERPPGKRCVQDPVTGQARQSFDPNAPPCVAYFDGDNGGETWRGVSRDEIRVVAYFDAGGYYDESTPSAGIYDLDKVPQAPCPKNVSGDPRECAHILFRASRALAKYFNEQFQTYNRRVHVYAHIANSAADAKVRRSDASRQLKELEPFAVLDMAVFQGYNQEYVDAAASRQMLVFSSQISANPQQFYVRNAPYAWGFWADVEHWSDNYASYICQKVAPHKVAHSGGPNGAGGYNGRDRKFGLFYTSDAGQPGLKHFRDLVKAKLNKCGVTWAAEGTFPESGFVINNRDAGDQQAQAVAAFRQAEVTTVLYLGGVEGKFSHAAQKAGYYPEIIVAGDGRNDDAADSTFQDQEVWKNAWVVSSQLREDRHEERPGYRAAKIADPQIDEDAAGYAAALYYDFFMLFQGIQVSGPNLNPDKIDQGFHAIPSKKSDDPYIAACFFDPNDYTCVKDSAEMWWDPTGAREGSNRLGCWRMVRGGERFLAWKWAGGDDVFQKRSDACHGRGGNYQQRLA